jgi:hypothetical protein
MNQDPYFSRPEVSNSDLSKIQEMLTPSDYIMDPTEAYRFGTLVDAIITEPHKVDLYNNTVEGEKYHSFEIELARAMKRSLMASPVVGLLAAADFQTIMSREMEIEHGGFKFTLPVRCKWDLYFNRNRFGGDIKSTTAKTQKQFEAACIHFNYPRQRAWYMDIAGAEKDVLIGISKHPPHPVFKIAIIKGDDFYNQGKAEYQELAFKYWTLFHNFNL